MRGKTVHFSFHSQWVWGKHPNSFIRGCIAFSSGAGDPPISNLSHVRQVDLSRIETRFTPSLA